MKKIQTAEEFINKWENDVLAFLESNGEKKQEVTLEDTLIEFAKLHAEKFQAALQELSSIYKMDQQGDFYQTPKKYLRKAIDPEGKDTNQDVYGYFEVNYITGEHVYKEEII
jgi:hypothetical protein